MSKYKLVMIIKSEAILGSGISNVFIHEDCSYDENGFVYYHAKTLKGIFHKTAEKIGIKNIDVLFGAEGNNEDKGIAENQKENKKSNITQQEKNITQKNGKLIFSNLEVPKEIVQIVNENSKLNTNEVLNLQTNIRQFIKINKNGTTEDGSLRNIRTIKDGMILLGEVYAEKILNEEEEKEFLFVLKATRNIGTMRNRGRGEVEFKLFKDNIDVEKIFREGE